MRSLQSRDQREFLPPPAFTPCHSSHLTPPSPELSPYGQRTAFCLQNPHYRHTSHSHCPHCHTLSTKQVHTAEHRPNVASCAAQQLGY